MFFHRFFMCQYLFTAEFTLCPPMISETWEHLQCLYLFVFCLWSLFTATTWGLFWVKIIGVPENCNPLGGTANERLWTSRDYVDLWKKQHIALLCCFIHKKFCLGLHYVLWVFGPLDHSLSPMNVISSSLTKCVSVRGLLALHWFSL